MGYTTFKDPSKNFFEGQGLFQPLQKNIGFTIDADEAGPTEEQKEFYHSIENKYDQIKTALIPLLNRELGEWNGGKPIADFDKEFELESVFFCREWEINQSYGLSCMLSIKPIIGQQLNLSTSSHRRCL